MDHNLEDSLTLEGMDFDHSEDVVNQEDIPLEDSGRLDSITMDMDVGGQSHNLMETVHDEVIVSDLIEDPFPFQEYTMPATSGHNLMIDPHQLNQLTAQHDPGVNLQYAETSLKQSTAAPAKSNLVTVKVAQYKNTKRMVATTPLRQVAIAPKPVPAKPVQYAIAPKPVALFANKHAVSTVNKIPISSSGNVKGSTVLAQIGRQLVMVPKKIKLMSSTAAEGIINPATAGLQYQVACSSDQAQLMTKGSKPLLKFIQIQGQGSADKTGNPSTIFTKVPSTVVASKARYVMQQKTVPITMGGNQVVQNFKIAGKKKIIAIQSQNSNVQAATQGNVATKKVVITSNAISNQKVLIKTNAPTITTTAIKEASSGQRTQFHPINVPGKGIQYIKLVTNQPTQKPASKTVVPAKNFVFTDSKGNIIQMTAEKVVSSQQQASNIMVQGTAPTSNKGVVKTVKTQKKLVRLAPVSKAASQSISQPARSSQSLLAPRTLTNTPTNIAMTSLPSLISPNESPVISETVSLQEFNDLAEDTQNSVKVQQSYSLANYVDNSRYPDGDDFAAEEDLSTEYGNEYSATEDASQMQDDIAEENVNSNETIDVKPTLQSLISDAVSEERESDYENTLEEYERKVDAASIQNASFMLQEDSNMEQDARNNSGANNEESIIIVPGTNYSEKANESLYSDESQPYRYSMEDRKKVPLLSVEAECLPYTEHMLPESPPPLSPTPDEAATTLDMRPRKACNCTKSQCLKLYCDCFANGEFCNNCNCTNCHNNLENEEVRQKAIRSCLERNPNAFRPKIGKSKTGGPEIIRRHTKGCNCKRSGCLKNYCECYEAKIACTAMCKCVGCRNVEETLIRRRDAMRLREKLNDPAFRPAPAGGPVKQPCSFMTMEVIEAVCQCLVAAGGGEGEARREPAAAVQDVIEEFARCLQDVITASHHTL